MIEKEYARLCDDIAQDTLDLMVSLQILCREIERKDWDRVAARKRLLRRRCCDAQSACDRLELLAEHVTELLSPNAYDLTALLTAPPSAVKE